MERKRRHSRDFPGGRYMQISRYSPPPHVRGKEEGDKKGCWELEISCLESIFFTGKETRQYGDRKPERWHFPGDEGWLG